MKIIFVMLSLKTGGGNRVFVELANKLIQKGNEVKMLFPNNLPDKNTFEMNEKIEIEAIGSLAQSKFAKFANLLRTIWHINRKHKHDMVIVSDPIISVFSFFLKVIHLYRYIQADDYCIYDDGHILGKGLMLKTYKLFCVMSYKG